MYGKCGSSDLGFKAQPSPAQPDCPDLVHMYLRLTPSIQVTPPQGLVKSRPMPASRSPHLTHASQVPNPMNLMPSLRHLRCLFLVNHSNLVTPAIKHPRHL